MTARDRLADRRTRHRRRPLAIRVAVALGGFSTLLAGTALLVLPGPGVPLVVVGLGLLALEFRWAEAALDRALRAAGRVTPRRRRHRALAGGAALAAASASAAVLLLGGVPFL
jgi:hypothetical protein